MKNVSRFASIALVLGLTSPVIAATGDDYRTRIKAGFEEHRQCMLKFAGNVPLTEPAEVSYQAALSVCRDSLVLSKMENLKVEMDSICPFELPPVTCDPQRNSKFVELLESGLHEDFLATVLQRKMALPTSQ